jgi:hypothetical protein
VLVVEMLIVDGGPVLGGTVPGVRVVISVVTVSPLAPGWGATVEPDNPSQLILDKEGGRDDRFPHFAKLDVVDDFHEVRTQCMCTLLKGSKVDGETIHNPGQVVHSLNSLTPMDAPMRPLFLRASQFCYKFLSFGPTSQPNTSKVSSALQLQSCCLSFAMHTAHQLAE